jgi:hypothetical protein
MGAALIPTDHKDRLPQSLSYPLGAQEISYALTGVPQYDGLTLHFSSSPTDSKSEFQNARSKGLKHLVLQARHSYFPETVSGIGFDTWYLLVYPVIREKRHVAHELLIENGLASVREWLSVPRTDTWLSRSHSLTITFVGSNETIQVYH